MIKKGVTISEAAHRWVDGFNAIPQGMIAKLMGYDPDDWVEVTVPARGNRVYVFGDYCQSGTLERINEEAGDCRVKLDDGRVVEIYLEDLEADYEDRLPMWGMMWSFGSSVDDTWLTDMDGIRLMSKCGFRIFENEEWGYFFGIDGAGYDFYSEHWIPLYKARGLQWHDPELETTDETVRKALTDLGVAESLVDRLMTIKKFDTECIGGYYGGHISDKDAQLLRKCNYFSLIERHGSVQEMSHLESNDYYIVTRKE